MEFVYICMAVVDVGIAVLHAPHRIGSCHEGPDSMGKLEINADTMMSTSAVDVASGLGGGRP